MTKDKITITTDISSFDPVRRVHIQVGKICDYYETYGETDDLANVLNSVAIGIKNKNCKALIGVR